MAGRVLGAAEREDLLRSFEATVRELHRLTAGVDREALTRSPAPGKWSVLEIICHLRDMDLMAFLPRYYRIAHEENPLLPAIDQDQAAVLGNYKERDPAQVLAEMRGLRAATAAYLRAQPEPYWSRTGVHQEKGPLTPGDLLTVQAGKHDPNHLEQIRRILQKA